MRTPHRLATLLVAFVVVAVTALFAQGDGNYFTSDQNTRVHNLWSGGEINVKSGATLAVESGATFTVADGSQAPGDLALARGFVVRGNSSGVGAAYDANDSGKILVGDGTDVASVAVSGDCTLASNGAITCTKLNSVKWTGGQASTVTASDTIASGLATVTSCVCVLEADPGDDPELVSCAIGDQAGAPAAGSFLLKTWKTNGTDPTPSAASTFSKKVNWVCKGT